MPCRSLWCSATLHPQWLASVDFAAQCPAPRLAALQEDDTAFPQVRQRIHASKQVLPLAGADNSKQLADAVLAAHRPGTLTLVIRNRVRDAVELFEILRKRKDTPPLCLLHSRFRPADRAAVLQAALAAPDAEGRIVVTTQVVEAGVDISAATLFTDVAPWASLVQRFGRCNRAGERKDARIFWLDKRIDREQDARPYALAELHTARTMLTTLADAAPSRLPDTDAATAAHAVLRAPDLLDLFDATPDLAGADIDVSRFIRGKVTTPTCRHSGATGRAMRRRRICPARPARNCAPCRWATCGPFAGNVTAGAGSGIRWTARGARRSGCIPAWSLLFRDADGGYSPLAAGKPIPERVFPSFLHKKNGPPPLPFRRWTATRLSHAARQSLREHGERTTAALRGTACGAGRSRSAILSAVAAHGGAAARLGQGAPRLSGGLYA